MTNREWLRQQVAAEWPLDCVIFPGAKSPKGYGAIGVENNKVGSAHRVAYELAFGAVPSGLHVLHRCKQQRACINPRHLYAGTPQQNTNDQIRDGTKQFGEQASRAKLTTKQVEDIRSLHAQRQHTQRDIGRMFGIHQSQVSLIVRRLSWKDAEEVRNEDGELVVWHPKEAT